MVAAGIRQKEEIAYKHDDIKPSASNFDTSSHKAVGIAQNRSSGVSPLDERNVSPHQQQNTINDTSPQVDTDHVSAHELELHPVIISRVNAQSTFARKHVVAHVGVHKLHKAPFETVDWFEI